MTRSLTDEAVSGVGWQFLSVAANIFLRALILILLARNLPPGDFGIIAAATMVMSVTQVLSQIGVSRVLVQRLVLSEDHIRSAFAICLYTGLIAMAGIYFAAPLISQLFRMTELTIFVQFLSVTLLFQSLGTVPASLLQRERRFRSLGLVELGSFVLGFGFIALPMAKADLGAWSLAVGHFAHMLSRTVFYYMLRRPAIGLRPHNGASGELLAVGSGFSAGQVGNFIATEVDYLIVGRSLGAEALGYYSRAYQFLMLPAQLFGKALTSVLFPSMASIQDQPERVGRAYLRAMGVIALLTLPSTGLLIVMAPELVKFVLGSEWEPMIVPFKILIATLLFRTSYKISDSVTLAMGSMVRRAWRQWIYAGAVVVGASLGLPWGLAGVAFGVAAAVALNFLLMLQLAMEVTGVRLGAVVRTHAQQVVASFLMVLPVWLVAELTRALEFGNTAVLSACTVTTAATSALLWFRFRGLFGADGAWLHALAVKRLRGFNGRNSASI
jgi:PST family polysaccharide transporter